MLNKKILYTAIDNRTIIDIYLPYILAFKNNGFDVYVATAESGNIPYVTKKYDIEFDIATLSVTNFDVVKSVKILKSILDSENFDVIHTHGLKASFITRLAAIKSRQNGTKIIYTADGFGFFEGAPKSTYTLYYSIEKMLSKNTDVIITINKEDYNAAIKNFASCKIYYIDGYGIDKEKVDIDVSYEMEDEIRRNLNIKDDDIIVLNVGDYTKDNNQEFLLDALKIIKDKTRNIKVIFVGKDKLDGRLKSLAREYDVSNNVIFLDLNQKDTLMLYAISDVYVDVSKVKNYPSEIIIAMINYLPVITTNVRGNADLITNNVTGYIVNESDIYDLCDKIMLLSNNEDISDTFIENCHSIYDNYLKENVFKQMCDIYNNIL